MNNLTLISPANNSYTETPDSYSKNFQTNRKVDFLSTEQLYNAVFENAFHSMYIGNPNGNILRFNEKLLKLFGYAEWEMKQNHYSDLFDIYDQSFIDFFNERKTKGIAKAELMGIKKSGDKFPCRISSVIYETDDGNKRSMNTVVNLSRSLESRWNIAG